MKSATDIIIAVIIVAILAFFAFFIIHCVFYNSKSHVTSTTTSPSTPPVCSPNERDVYSALSSALGEKFKIVLSNGTDAKGYLAFGTVNHQLFINYSYVYYIEQENFIKLYPPEGQYPGVLQIVPAECYVAAALLANTSSLHYTGGNYTVLLIGTYTHGGVTNDVYYPADGYSIALFVNPPKTPINDTTAYTSEEINVGMQDWPYYASGEIYFPYSTTPYVVVQWDPYWDALKDPWTTGEFNVWVVYPSPNGTVTEKNIKLLVGGGGNGFINGLSPGDLIEMEVTYDGYDNTIYAKVTDLNSSSSISITLSLCGTFTPPHEGWTEVNAGTGASYWNWGILYLSVFNNVYVNIEPK